MATIQEATQSAMDFARQTLGAERAKGLQLEEIESAKEGDVEVWRITLSMPDNTPTTALAMFTTRREYKAFTVVKSTGDVTTMKIREVSSKF